MPTLIDSPEFTANEINAVQGGDRLSGQFTGAEFSGLGNLNQAAQQLANRTAFLKGRQDTNIVNIAALQAFMSAFAGGSSVQVPWTSGLSGSGFMTVAWVRIPFPVGPFNPLTFQWFDGPTIQPGDIITIGPIPQPYKSAATYLVLPSNEFIATPNWQTSGAVFMLQNGRQGPWPVYGCLIGA